MGGQVSHLRCFFYASFIMIIIIDVGAELEHIIESSLSLNVPEI